MNRWEDAHFHQMQQLRWVRSEPGRRYLNSFQHSMWGDEGEPESIRWGDPAGAATEPPDGFLAGMVRQVLEQADPIYVASHVVDMIDHARETFRPEVILPTDLFVPVGFAYFPRPLVVDDARELHIRVRAMCWAHVRASENAGYETGGVWIGMFSADEDDHIEDMPNGEEPPRISEVYHTAAMQLVHSFFTPFNHEGWKQAPINHAASDADPSEELLLELARQQWALPQVFWRLASQLVRSKQRLPRAKRREGQRMGGPSEDVTVIQLRKERDVPHEDYEPGEGNFKVQWVVRGHWRNQWYPSLKEHRQIWIAPYVKGPEDAPLRVTERVFEFVR